MNSAQTTYSYFTGSNRLQSLTGARTRSYSYDAAGNMASDGLSTWSYGGDGRASQVIVGGLTVLFDINALGQRVRKSSAAGTTRFVYDEAGHLIGEYADDGTPIEETAWLGELPVAILKPDATGLYYVHPDHLGTPRMVTRPNDNAIVWRWDNTEAFGNSQPNQDPSGLGTFAYNLRFPGQYFDQETGTSYNYFRDYDPSIGRYGESDPIGLEGGINSYGYVRGNPESRIDSDGRLFTVLLNGVSRNPIDEGAAEGISNFSSAATLGAGGVIAAGAGLTAIGGAGPQALGEAAAATGEMVCRVVEKAKDPCRNAIIAAALGSAACQGKLPNSLRRDLERRDEIRRASESARQQGSGQSSSPGP